MALDVNDVHEWNRLSLIDTKLHTKVVEDIVKEAESMALECIRTDNPARAKFLADMKNEMGTILTRIKSNYKKNNKEMSNVTGKQG